MELIFRLFTPLVSIWWASIGLRINLLSSAPRHFFDHLCDFVSPPQCGWISTLWCPSRQSPCHSEGRHHPFHVFQIFIRSPLSDFLAISLCELSSCKLEFAFILLYKTKAWKTTMDNPCLGLKKCWLVRACWEAGLLQLQVQSWLRKIMHTASLNLVHK